MCMIDYADGCVEMLDERTRTAKKSHRCSECGRVIQPGESYRLEKYVWEAQLTNHKTCRHCWSARGWLSEQCNGFCFGQVAEDIHEHACEDYGFAVKLLSCGISKGWKRKDGKLWPVKSVDRLVLRGCR